MDLPGVIIAGLGVTGSLVTLAGAYRPVRRAIGARLSTFVGVPYRAPWLLESINLAIRSATNEVRILQTWMPSLNSDIGKWHGVSKSVDIKILLAADGIARERLRYRPHTIPLGDHNREVLSRFSSSDNVTLELRVYDGIPFGPIYIIDDEVYWGVFLSSVDSMLGPCFSCSRSSPIGKMIEASFDSIWSAHADDAAPLRNMRG